GRGRSGTALCEPAHRRQACAGPRGSRRRPAVPHAAFGARIPDLLQARRRAERFGNREGTFSQREDGEHLSLAYPRKNELQVERGYHLLCGEESTHRLTMHRLMSPEFVGEN